MKAIEFVRGYHCYIIECDDKDMKYRGENTSHEIFPIKMNLGWQDVGKNTYVEISPVSL